AGPACPQQPGSVAASLDGPRTRRNRGTDTPRRTHGHLWSLADGTGLHAPYGELVIESGTGRICCHLCGRWFVSLGGHLRAHGHTAGSYRTAMGLCRTSPLVAKTLSRSIADRQSQAYQRSPAVRARLAAGQQLSRTGQLATLARTARTRSASPELARVRRAALDAGRATRAVRREQALTRRLAELGVDSLADYLRQAYAAGASLRSLAAVTGLGWARLRREIDSAGIRVRPAGARRAQQRGSPV
ncbi:MAG: MucR family transcriptional regulator, partial [Gammaproteobacteria bacterium]